MPEELIGTVSPGDNPNWYDWAISNWGTKWDSDGAEVEWCKNKKELFYSFSTAWSPPAELLEKISSLYPTLTFKLRSVDQSMDWEYKLTICNDVREEENTNVTEDTKEYWGFEDEDE